MDKYCRGCKHQAFENNDRDEIWGFCLCKKEGLRGTTIDYDNEVSSYVIGKGWVGKLKSLEKDKFPSCQLVQSAYSEKYGKHCPYFEEE